MEILIGPHTEKLTARKLPSLITLGRGAYLERPYHLNIAGTGAMVLDSYIYFDDLIKAQH
jgi:hypothetical protein